jgi:hypothetical protein
VAALLICIVGMSLVPLNAGHAISRVNRY